MAACGDLASVHVIVNIYVHLLLYWVLCMLVEVRSIYGLVLLHFSYILIRMCNLWCIFKK